MPPPASRAMSAFVPLVALSLALLPSAVSAQGTASERELADAFLRMRVGVRVEQNGRTNNWMSKPEELPAGELTIVSVTCSGSKTLGDAVLARVRGMTGMHYLNLASSGVTETSLDTVGTLTGLRSLYLSGNPAISGRNLRALAGLTNLELLHMGTGAPDVNFSALPRLDRLVEFECVGNRLTDIRFLANIPNVQRLNVGGSLVTDFSPLATCAKLKNLGIQATPITDAQLAVIKDAAIENLNLSEAQFITDASVPVILSLSNLKQLEISKTRISPAGAQRLREAFPNAKITHNEFLATPLPAQVANLPVPRTTPFGGRQMPSKTTEEPSSPVSLAEAPASGLSRAKVPDDAKLKTALALLQETFAAGVQSCEDRRPKTKTRRAVAGASQSERRRCRGEVRVA